MYVHVYVCLCSTSPCWSSTTFLNRECLQTAWLPRGGLLWSCTSLLSLPSSDRKVACHSLGGETRPNWVAIDGCRLRVCSKAYSAYSYKRGACVGFRRDHVANECLASVNWCIFHVNQLLSSGPVKKNSWRKLFFNGKGKLVWCFLMIKKTKRKIL